MKIALLGKPGCGRSTLFRALAGSASADTSKPVTIDVPDPRLDFLTEIHKPEKKTHARVVFTDVPSPSLSPRNLALLRNAGVLAAVLDNYALGNLVEDFTELESELILADMAVCEKRLARLKKEGSGSSTEARLLKNLLAHMEKGAPLRTLSLDPGQLEILAPYALLSLKPLLVVSNRSAEPVTPEDGLRAEAELHGCRFLRMDAAFELELTEIDESERLEFLETMGYDSGGLAQFISAAHEALNLIVFFTVGKDEVRAWPLEKGATALDAAAAIHSDLARGFIRAVVAPWEAYRETPDRTALREKGMLFLEGKNYKVKDGDVVEIRFNV